MRVSIVAALLVIGVVFQAPALRAQDQRIEQLTPPVEQQIEQIHGGDDSEGVQRVEQIHGTPEQTVGEHIPPTPSEKAASNAGKFMLGVASAGVALGVMAASLLLL